MNGNLDEATAADVRRLGGIARYLASRKMARYLAARVAVGAGTLIVVTVFVFGAIHLIPGSYAEVVLPPQAPASARAALEREYGLNQSLPVQYAKWLRNVATGNFGLSLRGGTTVSDLLIRRVPVTLELALLALCLALLVGLPLALLGGMARGTLWRGGSRLAGAITISTPDFVIGSVLVYLFSRYALGLPAGAYVPFATDPLTSLRDMLLPALTLSVFGVALISRIGRDSVAGVLNEPYAMAALSRGESTIHIIRHHVLRNAAIPLVTVVAVYFGYLMGGAVVVENLFSLPGLGQEALFAINGRDYPVIQAIVLVSAAAFIGANMIADLSYGALDPRIRRTAWR